MTERIISIADERYQRLPPHVPAPGELPAGPPQDRLGRRLHDLRISVTDRCNFRCTYCMPKEVYGSTHPFLPRTEILSFEEITRLAALFLPLGVGKLRLTGGDCAALGNDLLQLRVHQPGVAEPVAYGEHGHHDPKAQQHDVGCRVNRGRDP